MASLKTYIYVDAFNLYYGCVKGTPNKWLTLAEREEIRRKLTEIDGNNWLDDDDQLTNAEKALLDARLAAYKKDPDVGSSWEDVESRLRARLKK